MWKKPTGVSDRLVRAVESKSIFIDILSPSERALTVDFSLNSGTCFDDTKVVVRVMVLAEMTNRVHMLFAFPVDRHTYSARGKVEDVSKHINEHMDKNQPDRIQAAVCWGDRVYKVTGVVGNLYLLWVESVTTYVNEGRGDGGGSGGGKVTRPEFECPVPMLVHTDGHRGVRAAYFMAPNKDSTYVSFVHPSALRLLFKNGIKLFTLDTDPPRPTYGPPTKLDDEQVRVIGEQETVPHHEAIPAISTLIVDYEYERAAHWGAGRSIGGGTNRIDLQLSSDAGMSSARTDPDEDAADEFFACIQNAAAATTATMTPPPRSGSGGSGSNSGISRHTDHDEWSRDDLTTTSDDSEFIAPTDSTERRTMTYSLRKK